MKKKDRERLTTNDMYMNECMSILYTKIKSTGYNVFDNNGKIQDSNTFYVESDNHGAVTISTRKGMTQLGLDGTNYKCKYYRKDKRNYVFRNEILGIEYVKYDEELGDGIRFKKISRISGETVDYVEYLTYEDSYVLLKHCIKDESGTTIVLNKNAQNCSKTDLYEYMKKEIECREDAEENSMEDQDQNIDLDGILGREDRDELEQNKEDQEEIRIFSEEECSDYTQIDYTIDGIDDEEDEPYKTNLPCDVNDFCYSAYIKNITSREQIESALEKEKNEIKSSDLQDPDEPNDSEFEDELDEDSDENLDGESVFIVLRNDRMCEDKEKSDISDESMAEVMNFEIETNILEDYIADINREVEKMKSIIVHRRINMDRKKKNNSDGPNERQCNKNEDDKITR